MIYSVYDHRARRWRYFDGPGSIPTTAFFRDTGVGSGLSRIAATLPAGAVAVGSGNKPRGVIAVEDGGGESLAAGGDLGLGLGQAPGGSGDGAPSGVLSWLGLVVVLGGAFWLGRKSVAAEAKVRAKVRGALS